MRKNAQAFTRVDLVATILLVVTVGWLVSCRVRHGHRPGCNSYLGQIVKACTTYQEPNGGFFPSLWDGTDHDNPMMSLALLYPAYIDNPKFFGCPRTDDRPAIITVRVGGALQTTFGPVSGNAKSSFMYDPRVHFRDIGPLHALAADADGHASPGASNPNYPPNWTRKPRKPNHQSGQNVMYFDGHVKWQETNYASEDPLDNIYCPNTLPGPRPEPWHLDSDAYLWDGANPRPRQMPQ